MKKATLLLILLSLSISPFSFAQEREKLDSVFINNKDLLAREVILKFKKKIAENYFVDTISLTIKKEFIQKLSYLDFEIEPKKLKLVPKNRREEFKKEIDRFANKTKNSNSTSSFESTFAFQQKSLEKASIKSISAPKITSAEVKLRDFPKLIEEFETILSKYIDKEDHFTIKTGVFPIDRDLAINDKSLSYENESQHALNTYSWPKEKIINPGLMPFLSHEEAYDYKIKKTFFYQEQKAYKINFKPKKNRAKLTGFCIISTEDFALLRAKYELVEGEKAWGVNLKFPLGVKVNQPLYFGELSYKKNTSGKYIPTYYELSEGEYTYLHRDILIKTQTGFFKRSDKLKINFLMESQEVTTQKFSFSAF
ncbi:hypothetical protein ACFQ3R_14065 [Mesonia ostreae]|uniref:Uncharacterized protein n=1 Tax=Mesonia ostreae TaxID=861110 RepID=A0ABU2KM99_9FLAO|nr:hypothetical protein [Mesonia ostreae]MDT0295841.1 hypothetical protein [Mesonia ostreae]